MFNPFDWFIKFITFSITAIRFAHLYCLKIWLVLYRTFYTKKQSTQPCVVIFNYAALGDMVCTLGVVKQIYNHYHAKGHTVILITNSSYLPWLNQFNLADVIEHDEKGPMAFYRMILKYNVTEAIYLGDSPSRTTMVYCMTLPKSATMIKQLRPTARRLADGETILRHHKKHGFKKIFSYFSTRQKYLVWNMIHSDLLKLCFTQYREVVDNTPIQQSQINLVNHFCHANIKIEACTIPITPSLPEAQISGKYYIVVPGGSFIAKRWPLERFAELINRLQRLDPSYKPVICGDSRECGLAQQLLALLEHPEKVIDLTGKSSFSQLFADIKSAQFLITNDTGTAHIAAQFHVPQVCIVSSIEPGVYLPNSLYSNTYTLCAYLPCQNCRGFCHCYTPDKTLPCVDCITVQQVWDTLNSKILRPLAFLK